MGKTSMPMGARDLLRASLWIASAVSLASVVPSGLAACGEKKGGLMLAVTTDMRAPKDVNVVTVAIQVGDEVKYNFTGRVTPEGEVLLPATLAIVEPPNVGTVIKVRVIAFKDTEPKVLRDITTTAPTGGRVALLRMPLSFVNEGSARGQLPVTSLPSSLIKKSSFPPYPTTTQTVRPLADPFNPWGAEVTTICSNVDERGNPYTMIDGECRSSFVDSSALPEFSKALVWPNGDEGACFDAKACLVGWRVAEVNLDTCTAPKGGDVKNVTLVTPSTGDCNENGKCFIPIDKEEDNAITTGWREVGDNIVLSKGICKKLRQASGTKLGFTGNAACPSKSSGAPICNGKHPALIPDGGGADPVDAGDGGPVDDLPAGVEKKIAADMASGIAVFSDRIYFGSRDGLYMAPEGQPARLIQGSPTGPFPGPWFVSQFGSDVAFGLGVPIDAAGAQRAFVLRSGNALRALAFNDSINGTVRGAAISTPHAWFGVAGGTGSGDLYSDDGSTDAERGLASGAKNITALAYTSADTLFVGLPDGHVDICDGSTGSGVYCLANGATDSGQAVEAIGVSDAAPDQAFVLTPNSVHLVKKMVSATPTITRLVTADLAGISDVNYFPRGIAANAKCGFFASKTGVGYTSFDGQSKGALVTLPERYPVTSVAAPVLGASPTATHVYFVVRANGTTTGGVYRVPIPAACN